MLNCVTWAQCSINNEWFWIGHILLYQNLALMQTKTKTQIKTFVDTNLFQNLMIGKKQHCSITFPILATLKKFRWYKCVGPMSTFIGWTLSLIPLTPWRRLAIFTSTVNLLLQMNGFESYQSLTSYTEHWRMSKFDFSPRPPLNLKTCVWILISWTIRYNHHREKPAGYETESTVGTELGSFSFIDLTM